MRLVWLIRDFERGVNFDFEVRYSFIWILESWMRQNSE